MSELDAEEREILQAFEQGKLKPVKNRQRELARHRKVAAAECERMRGANTAEFQAVCDRVSQRAAARDLTEDKLSALLEDDAPASHRR